MAETISVPGLVIERLIARGGMAEVYLAEQKSLGRKVAVKVMDPRKGDADFATRFLHEAKLLATLTHNNIITIYDFGTLAGGRLYLTMEYLAGGDLEGRIKRSLLPQSDAIRILRELARALSFVHKQGVLHRDIKPANILFRRDGSLVLTDFGIAKGKHEDSNVTQTGMTVGSPAYSSPEQAQGLELDAGTDIYSVGVVALEMLTGSNPFRASTNIDTAIKHIQMPVPRLSGKLARYQPLLGKMLAKKPKERFRSMLEVLEMLDRLEGGGEKHVYGDVSTTTDLPIPGRAKELLESCAKESNTFGLGLLNIFHEDMLQKLEALLDASRLNTQRWQFTSITREFRGQREIVSNAFIGQLEAGFKAFERGEYQQDNALRGGGITSLNQLSLVANEELERNIAAADLVKRSSEALQSDLLLLHERLCELTNKELPVEACPIGPYQLAQYFKKALESLQLDKQLNALCFKTLEKLLVTQARELYQSLNKMLAEAGILPSLTYGEMMRRRQVRPAAEGLAESPQDAESQAFSGRQTGPHTPLSQGSREITAGQAASQSKQTRTQAAVIPDPELPSVTYQQQLFSAIRHLQSRAAETAPGPTAFAPPSLQQSGRSHTSGNRAAVDLHGPVYARDDIVTALHGLQGNVAWGAEPEKTGVLQAFREIKPGNIHVAPVQNLETVIQAITDISPDGSDEPKQLGAEDSNIIHLVGMIFEYMLKDDELPDAAKALLSYLHVPYIKVALLDPELFSGPEHPARLLLDRLSEAGSLWLNKEGFGQFKVFDEIKRVVDSILTDFDSGTELFVHLLAEFEDFVSKVKRRIDQLEKLSAQKVEAEQHLQKVKAHVHACLKARVNAERLPAPIVSMLLYPWFDYLVSIMLRYGVKSEEWSQTLQLVDTLLWSIKPKTTQHEIHRLNNVREFLSTQIQKGFDTVGFDEERGAELLEQIGELQDKAAKAGATEIVVSAIEAEVIERMRKDTLTREKVVEPPKPSEMTEHEKELVEKLRMIEFGTWFEFREQDNPNQSQKLKVAWYNPENLSYLMVNSAGKQVSMMTALELARQMLSQSARIIAGSAKPFFERALESIYRNMASATATQAESTKSPLSA